MRAASFARGLSAAGAFAVLTAAPALAQTDAKIDPADTAWMIVATALVLIQLYGIVVTFAWAGIATAVLLKAVSAYVPLRVDKQSEIEGLDVTQHGEALQ
jgi:ammonia channel protein AmtB